MSPRAIQRRVVVIKKSLIVGGQFTFNIPSLGFEPDEMIVVSVAFHDPAPADILVVGYSNLVPGQQLFCLSCNNAAEDRRLETRYTMTGPVDNKDWRLYMLNESDAVSTLAGATIGITLEFVQFAK